MSSPDFQASGNDEDRPSPADEAWLTEELELDDLLGLYLDERDNAQLDGDGELPAYDPLRGYEP